MKLSKLSYSITCALLLAVTNNVFAEETAIKEADDIETIEVKGFKRDYIANKGQTSAVGLDLSLLETPAAISVISQDILTDQQVNNVDDALRNVAGVTKFKTGNGGEEKFSIRGFDASQSLYKDGARINNALNVSNIPSTETANIERIEVLKGPSALLYGQGEPGGIINYITKRPQFAEYGSMELIVGSYDFYKAEFDYTNALLRSDSLAFRVVGSYEDSDSFRAEVERKRLLLNPTLMYKPNEDLALTLGYEFIDDDYTNERGQVLDLLNPAAAMNEWQFAYTDRINPEQFFGIPGWNKQTTAQSNRLYLLADYYLSDNWQLQANVARTKNDKDNFDSSPGTLAVDSDEVSIRPSKSIGSGEADQFNVKSMATFNDGLGFEHQLLISAAWESRLSRSTSFRSDRSVSFNLASGEYLAAYTEQDSASANFIRVSPDIGFILNPRAAAVNDDVEEYGVNVLDYIRFNQHWAWLIGGRYSSYDDVLGERSDADFSVRTGVVYTPVENQSYYLSYSEGYTPSSGLLGLDDRTVDPETSVSYELGAKHAFFDEQLIATATLYQVELNDIPYVINPFDENGQETAPEDIRFGNVGGAQSRGVEFELVGQLTDAWRIQGGYAYVDNEITVSGEAEWGDRFVKGNRFPGVSKHNFNVFSFYEFDLAGGEFGLGGGVFYSGDVFISTENRSKYDSWTTLDLAAYYKKDNWKAQLNIRNVSDEQYQLAQYGTTTDAFAAVRVGTASPRSIYASIAYEF
jgi:TonB-dependent siderophore receptor